MTNHRARDDWADAQLGETLHRALDGLAGQAATASSIEGALGSVRTRVRRRRAAKKAGLGVTTLAVAGGLVVGGSALVPRDPVVLPQPAGPPSPSETARPAPTEPGTQRPGTERPGTDGAALEVIQDGYQPPWLEGTGLVCGMPAGDLPATAEGLDLTTGSLTSEEADPVEGTVLLRWPTELAVETATPGTLIGPTLLWTQDGRVVDLGLNATEEPVPYDGGPQVVERDATDWTGTSCAPDESTEPTQYLPVLPEGEYEVRAYYVLWSQGFRSAELVLSDPTPVTVDELGVPR